MTVPLVLISLNKAEYLAMAMETRGYGGGPRTYLREPRMGNSDYCMIILLFLFFVLVVSLRWAGYGIMF